jgi:maltose/moltooligosaccharide transporter
MKQKPALSFWQIWNMCFGFLGIQMGFALQNANVSRIFQTLGAAVDDIPILWVAAPLTGPGIAWAAAVHISWWARYSLRCRSSSCPILHTSGSPQACCGLWMPASTSRWSLSGPSLVTCCTTGFAMQTFFIGIGAVVASALPWVMTNWLDVSNTAPAGQIPESVKIAFYVGGAAFLLAVSWTVFRTKEYSPEELAEFEAARPAEHVAIDNALRPASRYRNGGLVWLVVGAALLIWIFKGGLDKELYVLGGGITAFGIFQLITASLGNSGQWFLRNHT